jgi:drug/metabolite transporter (DMT)-like permease
MDYVCADYTWARAVLLLGSTAATLGMSLQIPLATAGDLLLQRHPHWLESQQSVVMTCVGTVAILAGILGINLAAAWRQDPAAGDAGSSTTVAVQEPLLGQADAVDSNA